MFSLIMVCAMSSSSPLLHRTICFGLMCNWWGIKHWWFFSHPGTPVPVGILTKCLTGRMSTCIFARFANKKGLSVISQTVRWITNVPESCGIQGIWIRALFCLANTPVTTGLAIIVYVSLFRILADKTNGWDFILVLTKSTEIFKSCFTLNGSVGLFSSWAGPL